MSSRAPDAQVSGGVVVDPRTILGAWPAVANVGVAARERSQQVAGFLEERVVFAIARAEERAEEPPDVSPRAL